MQRMRTHRKMSLGTVKRNIEFMKDSLWRRMSLVSRRTYVLDGTAAAFFKRLQFNRVEYESENG
jgi:hypothetical protein